MAERSVSHGVCGAGGGVKLARAALHMWEEPVLVGHGGSGAVFFSHCTMRCVYCQNHEISCGGFGKEISDARLSQIFLELADKGAENIDLISPTPYLPNIINALDMCRSRLSVPVAYNTSGYERRESIDMLSDYVSIFLPDMKYVNADIAEKYSGVRNYPEYALAAIGRMLELEPNTVIENGVMKRGVIIRHLVLPSHKNESIEVLRTLADKFGTDGYYLSLMRQYTPCHRASEYKEINRRLTSYEYNCVAEVALQLGFKGFFQEKGSASSDYTPPFDLEGV